MECKMKSLDVGPIMASIVDSADTVDNIDPQVLFAQLHKKALSMGIRQHQLCRLKYVTHFRQVRWKRMQYALLKGLRVLVCIVFSLAATWVLDWPLPRHNMARVVWKMRGEKHKYVESERCLLKASKWTQDLARPPISCEFCEGLTDVPRVSRILPSTFESRFAYSGQPVVVTDGASNWSAVEVFSFEFFKDVYQPGSSALRKVKLRCQFFPYRTEFRNLGEVFQMDQRRASLADGSQPWYIGWSNCDMTAGHLLRQHYHRPYFLPDHSESSKTDWMFMGSPGYGAHMHIDNVRLPSWQAQITGNKKWTLEPPPECYFRCVSKLEVTVNPGEIIVLDTNKWFHSTLVVGSDISITIGSEYD